MTPGSDPAADVVVRRLLRAPRERVFAAWLDPDSLVQWMCPGDVTHASADVDARVGGRFRIVMTHGRGDAEHWGEYLEIDPPSRLVFTWISVNTDRMPTIVTVELFERDGGTELMLTHRHLPGAKVDAHRKGWADIVSKLDAVLAR
jgi:uncharacterized protein YndB with AHSA1/START domain